MTTSLSIDVQKFDVSYQVNGAQSADYRLLTMQSFTFPAPFNTKNAPFLFPRDVQTLGFNVRLSGTGDPFYWSCRIEFVQSSNFPEALAVKIASHGFNPNGPLFTSVESPAQAKASAKAILPNIEDSAGFTPIDAIPIANVSPPSNLFLFQPDDFPVNEPIQMRISVFPHSTQGSTGNTNLTSAPGMTQNVIDVWIARA